MSYDVDEGRTDPVVETGENLRFWACKGARAGEVANMPFAVAFAAPAMVALIREALPVIREEVENCDTERRDCYFGKCPHGKLSGVADKFEALLKRIDEDGE